ncbi:hypothetical protein DHEL01_v200649 [Diaporthe helianthi]|uniref:Uncharacterized protein n=1 Tax=Diaporthe helianthi TaxID=158607 RepID=A0A2P5IEP9_DIAHE|nr:hypothetical protein DHEL01_v200649 [Diaporthe helianthi]
MLVATLFLATAQLAAAINFANWDPQPGLPAEFKPFLKALVNAAENATAGVGYTDFFPPDGMQTTESIHCVGAAGIERCKQAFLVNGRELVHFPNKTFVASNNETATTYESWGRMEQTYPAPISNCSQLYYQTQYTVLKKVKGVHALPNLLPLPQQQVYWYHDLLVRPFALISDIPCDSLKTAKTGLPLLA